MSGSYLFDGISIRDEDAQTTNEAKFWRRTYMSLVDGPTRAATSCGIGRSGHSVLHGS